MVLTFTPDPNHSTNFGAPSSQAEAAIEEALGEEVKAADEEDEDEDEFENQSQGDIDQDTMSSWSGQPAIKGSSESMRMALLTFSMIGLQYGYLISGDICAEAN